MKKTGRRSEKLRYKFVGRTGDQYHFESRQTTGAVLSFGLRRAVLYSSMPVVTCTCPVAWLWSGDGIIGVSQSV